MDKVTAAEGGEVGPFSNATPDGPGGRDLLFLLRSPASGSLQPNAAMIRRLIDFSARPARSSSEWFWSGLDVGSGQEPAQISAGALTGPQAPRGFGIAMGFAAGTSDRSQGPIRSSRPCWGAPKVKAVRVFPISANPSCSDLRGWNRLILGRSRTQEYLAGVLPPCRPGSRRQPGPGCTAGGSFKLGLDGRFGKKYLRATEDHAGLRPAHYTCAQCRECGKWPGGRFVRNTRSRWMLERLGLWASRFRYGGEAECAELVEPAAVKEFGAPIHDPRARLLWPDPLENWKKQWSRRRSSRSWVKELRKVSAGPENARGVADIDGRGATVSGIVS